MVELSSFLVNFLYIKNNPLLFTNGLFFLIFTIFLILYSTLFRHKKCRTFYILLFSLFFYYKTSGIYVLILIASIVFNFYLAQKIDLFEKKKIRRLILILGIVVNVSMICFFKYTNFIFDNLNLLFHGKFQNVDIFLPIGISFFTFQTISYLVDVYRRTINPCLKIIDYAFYVSFFPYIIAGPITRAKDFLIQNKNEFKIESEDINEGLYLIIRGLIKKAIYAQYIAQYCDLIFGTPSGYSGIEHIIGMYGYTLQVYFDFSGYSDMAIGIARIMGFRLKDNFNEPYKSHNLSEFWSRWHISLSTWFRDYLFLPITYLYLRFNKEDSKLTLLKAYILAAFITMLVAGLWHGAANKFVFWGGSLGVGLIINRFFLVYTKKSFRKRFMPNWLGWLITFHLVAFLWVFFRADSFQDATLIIRTMFQKPDPAYLIPFIKTRTLLTFIMITGSIMIFLPSRVKSVTHQAFLQMPYVLKGAIFLLVIQLVIQMQTTEIQPFIYSQF